VVQRRRRARFPLEAAQALAIRREAVREYLDRDLAAEARVLRAEDLSHPAGADRREKLVRAEARPGREGHALGATTHYSTEVIRRGDEVLGGIGGTPLVALSRIVPAGSARVVIKLEWANPTGSMKDRMAKAVVEAAERDGRLSAGGTVVEYTAGTTGIS